MKVIALLPVRNEAWVLRHSLPCLSTLCDVVLVSDQNSEDASREICREFANVEVIASRDAQICEQARWALWDAARSYDGRNLIWCTDADELVSPRLALDWLARSREALAPGDVVECRYYHVWDAPDRYRDSVPPYVPYWKPVAVVDDRRIDYARTRSLPLHEERVPVAADARRARAAGVPVLHLQWLLPARTQMRQAWYRCREWMHGERSAHEINLQYVFTLPRSRVRTAPVPHDWVADVTFPDLSIDREVTWQEREVLDWFADKGPAFFEPLEIWHVPVLRDAFVRSVGRGPRPDRSHHPSLSARAAAAGGKMARRVVGAARRRLSAVLQ